MRVECRVTHDAVAIWSLGPEPTLLATHARARRKGAWVVDRAHWDGLPFAPESSDRPPCERASDELRADVGPHPPGRHAGRSPGPGHL